MDSIELISAFINTIVSATIFMGCIVLVAAFWLH
jgi:hypothetical protein